jgi:hypothetical protein
VAPINKQLLCDFGFGGETARDAIEETPVRLERKDWGKYREEGAEGAEKELERS